MNKFESMIKDIFPIRKWSFDTRTILADLPADDLKILSQNMSGEKYAKGEIVFKEGGYPTGIFFIEKGKVKKYKTNKEGKEQIIYVANSGELIGYHALLADERYPDAAATLEESKISFIPREDFLKALYTSKVLAQRLLKTLSHEFSVLVNSVASLAQQSVKERFAMQLILLREKYKQNFTPGMEVEINMTREDLANLVGTSRENIVRILKDFKNDGILRTQGTKIFIRDINQLLRLSNH
jgi:CRP-like cAMP-binding protein